MVSSKSLTLGLACLSGLAAGSSFVGSMPKNAQQLFTESMSWMDTFYDESAGYLYDVSASAALRHETRSSVWYALGLLARNEDDDVVQAERIIRNTISGQYKVVSEQWYGDYQKQPQEPYVGSAAYPASIYRSWDPNWRGFVGTTFVMVLEEFPHLLGDDLKDIMLESLYNTTKGDEYRVGGVNGDNLYPSYSNPAIMRAFTAGWVGRRLKNCNITESGEKYARDIINLFNRADTLSEFNSGTYTGVSLFGLTLWNKYLPKSSIMHDNGARMVRETWKTIAQLWHPGMKNMAGPWDRSYGYDMNRYLSLMGLWFWVIIGKENSSVISNPQVMSHMGDYAWAPLFAVLGKFHTSLLPDGLEKSLATFQGEHTFTSSSYYPPYDYVPRNITTWMSDKITIGAESFNETVVGGPSVSRESFNPAVIQWNTGSEISFISLYPQEKALNVKVTANRLELSYPTGTAKSTITLIVGTFKNKRDVRGWSDVQGLDVKVSGSVNPDYTVTFGGANGGASGPLRDFEYWKFTYTMPKDSKKVPSIVLNVSIK